MSAQRVITDSRKKMFAIVATLASILLFTPILDGDLDVAVVSIVKAVSGAGLSGIIGYIAMVKLSGPALPKTAKEYAKLWFGYLFFVICVTRLTLFFIHLDVEYLAQFTVLIIFYGGLAAICGYVFGKFKLKKERKP
jgi:dolichol kinase|tara:strand:+ start:136 stop:546 length:411 start_codon:yes stop_codon:yes gene_type:complete